MASTPSFKLAAYQKEAGPERRASQGCSAPSTRASNGMRVLRLLALLHALLGAHGRPCSREDVFECGSSSCDYTWAKLDDCTWLFLSDNSIGDVGAAAISKALPESQLMRLDLFNNSIGDAGAVEISKALPKSQLTTLDLRSNSIGEVGRRALDRVVDYDALPEVKHRWFKFEWLASARAEWAEWFPNLYEMYRRASASVASGEL